jgi:hypothetical protein
MKAEGQWIVMMGFLVSLGIFFLAIIISQSTLVGQTTAEGVLEFPKNDIQDLRHVILEVENFNRSPQCTPNPGCSGTIADHMKLEIQLISLYRKSAIINYSFDPANGCGSAYRSIFIHYNNGVTVYDENPLNINC